MNLRFAVSPFLLVGIMVCIQSQGLTFADRPSRPNVIFYLTDDMGYSGISCYGAKIVSTPNIDALAAKGFRFTDFHTGSSICSHRGRHSRPEPIRNVAAST